MSVKWIQKSCGYFAEDASGKTCAMVYGDEGGYSVWTDEGYGFVGLYPDENEAKAAAEEVLSLPKQLELFATE